MLLAPCRYTHPLPRPTISAHADPVSKGQAKGKCYYFDNTILGVHWEPRDQNSKLGLGIST